MMWSYLVADRVNLVIWGLHKKYDTYRYIHSGFAAAGQRLGWSVRWVDDEVKNQSAVDKGSLVIGVNLCQRNLPVVAGARYVIHNNERADLAATIDAGFGINLQTWTFECPGRLIDEQEAIRFNSTTRTLFQPWGTSIPSNHWSVPNYSTSRLSFWVGSIWDNALGQGNRTVIDQLSQALRGRNRRLVHFWRTPERAHQWLIEHSGLRPAVCGQWQTENGYIPCRAFKNLSFGALPVTNNRAVNVALGESIPHHTEMSELVDAYFSMPESEVIERTAAAQSNLYPFTYESNLRRFVELVG